MKYPRPMTVRILATDEIVRVLRWYAPSLYADEYCMVRRENGVYPYYIWEVGEYNG